MGRPKICCLILGEFVNVVQKKVSEPGRFVNPKKASSRLAVNQSQNISEIDIVGIDQFS